MRRLLPCACGAAVLLALAGCSPAQRERAGDQGRAIFQKAGQTAADMALAEKVRTALKLHKGLDVRHIEVNASARDGVVRLAGSVPDMHQYKTAQDVAQSTDGVRQVVNDLGVPPAKVSANPR
jgi:osmotically-inducible protein OsmY